MKKTEIKIKSFHTYGEDYTMYAIGRNVVNPSLVRSIKRIGGRLVKETSIARYYEIKGHPHTWFKL